MTQGAGTDRVHPWVMRVGRLFIHDIGAPVEGTIVTAAVLAVTAAHAHRPTGVVIACAVVLGVYWLSHVYLHALRDQYDHSADRLHVRLGHHARHQIGVLAGGVPAVLAFLIGIWLGLDLSAAAYAALGWTVIQLGGIVFATSRVTKLSRRRSLAESFIASLFGVALIVAKVLLH